MEFRDKLNTKNMFSSFGLVIQTGTGAFLAFPERKDTFSTDWRESNGKDYDLKVPVFKDKQISLKCAIMANNDVDFWTKRNALFVELSKAGFQDLFIHDHSKTYKVFYKSSSNWQKRSKRLKNVPKVFVKFDLILVVQ